MTSQSIPLFNPVRLPEMEQAALEVFRSGLIASGPGIAQFEREFEQLVGRPHAVTTSDMTGAIHLALILSGVGHGDEVATLAFSCLSSNSPIAIVGAVPLWIDVDPATMSMSVPDLERKITSRTKAVMLYHVAGYPGPARKVAEICRQRGIALIEDCNNALGAQVDGQPVGAFGDRAVYSLYPNRQINGIDGGILLCKDETEAARARKLRRFGIDGSSFRDGRGEINPASDVTEIGWSVPLNHVNAKVASSQLASLGERILRTQAVGRQLQERLANVHNVRTVSVATGRSAFWACLLLVSRRDELLAHLKSQGVQASILHHRNDHYTGFHAGRADLPGTADAMSHLIAVPSGWWLSEDDIDRIVGCIETFAGRQSDD